MVKKGIRFIIFLAVLMFLMAGDYSYAVNYDQQIESVRKEQKDFEKKAADVQKEIQELDQVRGDALKYVEKMDKKTMQLEESLADLAQNIRDKQEELERVKRELLSAQEEEKQQYIMMKKRIKYMYENGTQEYWQILFGASGITDLLNRSEYVEKISRYDKDAFDRYKKIKNTVQEKETKVKQAVDRLTELKRETQIEKQAVRELKEKKKKQLKKYNKKLKTSQKKTEDYTKKALQAEHQVEELLQKKQEEIDREQATGQGNSEEGNSGAGFIWPLSRGVGRISSRFGHRESPTAGASSYHKGIDLAAPSGTSIVAAGSGKVVTALYSSSAGNYIMISHGNRLYTVYMHCSHLAVKVGDSVKKGQVIAYVGSTGISTGSHLHFGVFHAGTYDDPLNYVSR